MSEIKTGKVYLIGAGPGDPELITLRGKSLLSVCDTVIYDNLISFELVITLPDRIEKIYVGTRAGRHTLPQDEINRLLVNKVREGKIVVRLKGGDPFIFGRGGEEAMHLKEHGIDFEIVPGLTAGYAGLTYAGIPCTDRLKSSMVVFVTGHRAMDKDSNPVAWDWLAKIKNGTIVIYMGVTEIANIVEALIKNGMAPDKPAAIIERGTFSTQRVFTAPVSELARKSADENIRPPALYVIGEVVELHQYLDWFENKPLFGKRIMILRPTDQAADLYRSLRRLGAEILPYPTIATNMDDNPAAWQKFDDLLEKPASANWLIFTSENCVRYFIEKFASSDRDMRRLSKFKIAAVGFGTSRALKKYSLKADFMPSIYTTENLIAEMAEKQNLKGARAVRVRGNLADQRLEDGLTRAGAKVIALPVYRTYHPEWPDGFKPKLFENPPDIIICSSGSTVDGLHKLLSKTEIEELVAGADLISIGPMTTRVIESYGLKAKIEAREHSIPGIIEELKKHYGEI